MNNNLLSNMNFYWLIRYQPCHFLFEESLRLKPLCLLPFIDKVKECSSLGFIHRELICLRIIP